MKDPQTPQEWQEAVDWAHFCLVLDSARQYGLITGGPKINVKRCAEILERGKAQGSVPSQDCIECCTEALMKGAKP